MLITADINHTPCHPARMRLCISCTMKCAMGTLNLLAAKALLAATAGEGVTNCALCVQGLAPQDLQGGSNAASARLRLIMHTLLGHHTDRSVARWLSAGTVALWQALALACLLTAWCHQIRAA